MKNYFLILIFMLTAAASYSQDSLHLFVDGKPTVSFLVSEEAVSKSLKNFTVGTASKLLVQFEAELKNTGPYKQSLEITDCHDSQSETFSLTDNNYAGVDISPAMKKFNFFKGCYVKIYLLLNPANDMMMIPSRRIFLGDLSLQ